MLDVYFSLRLERASLREADRRQMDSKDKMSLVVMRAEKEMQQSCGGVAGSAALDGGVL